MTEATLLLRQINPNFVQQGRVTSQAFRPTPKDQSKLSVFDGDLITPCDAWKQFTSRGFQSAGVQAVTVAECAREALPARPSPMDDFPSHAEIDFSGCTANQCDKKAKRIRVLAEIRGWLYQP
jgi:hypothetical protein